MTASADHWTLRSAPAGQPRARSRALIRVVLGQDDFLAREGIARVLESLDGIELGAVCADLDSLRREIERTDPDVVVVDAGLPPGGADGGVRLAAELRSTRPLVGVVVISSQASSPEVTALFADGAFRRAYLLREWLRDPADLARTIREVAEGGAVVDPRIIDQIVAARREHEHSSPLSALTPRELEIVALIAEGLANSAIADRLGITKRGVERHINGIFAKLDLGEPADVSRRVKTALLLLADQPS